MREAVFRPLYHRLRRYRLRAELRRVEILAVYFQDAGYGEAIVSPAANRVVGPAGRSFMCLYDARQEEH